MDGQLREVEAKLKARANAKRAKASANSLRTPMKVLGVTVPEQRTLLETGFSFSNLPEDRQNRVWEHVFLTTQTHEAGNLALIALSKRLGKSTPADWPRLKRLAKHVNNWEHADRVAALIADLHERHPRAVYPTLKDWNEDPNAWLRRLSLTSLLYYSRNRKTHPACTLVFPLVKRLLRDPNPYVQKAVGWTLRECGNVYPKDTTAFVRAHAQDLSGTAFSYATERDLAPLRQKRRKTRAKS
jgi:3-methyladenine DNA glycosylase AlkD